MKRKFDPLYLIAGEDLLENITYSSFCVRKEHGEREEHRAMYIFKGNGLCKRHFEEESSLNNTSDLENKVTTAENEMSLKDMITEDY